MARRTANVNIEWLVPDGVRSYDALQLEVLMDIRCELQRLNRLLHCDNFQQIPRTLRSIRKVMPVKDCYNRQEKAARQRAAKANKLRAKKPAQ